MSHRFYKTKTGLVPADKAASDYVAELGVGEFVEMDVLHERDMVAHRRIFAQIAEAATAMHITPDLLRAKLLMQTGNFKVLGDLFGKTVVSVNSMSRHAMKDDELHAFWDEARRVLLDLIEQHVTDAAERKRLVDSLSLQPA